MEHFKSLLPVIAPLLRKTNILWEGELDGGTSISFEGEKDFLPEVINNSENIPFDITIIGTTSLIFNVTKYPGRFFASTAINNITDISASTHCNVKIVSKDEAGIAVFAYKEIDQITFYLGRRGTSSFQAEPGDFIESDQTIFTEYRGLRAGDLIKHNNERLEVLNTVEFIFPITGEFHHIEATTRNTLS